MEKKQEYRRIRKHEQLKKKKAASSFEGFSDIASVLVTDKTPAPPKEQMPSSSTPVPLSDFWAHHSFSGLLVTDACLLYHRRDWYPSVCA